MMIMVVVIMNMEVAVAVVVVVVVVMMITTIIIMMMNTRARHGVGGRDELNLLKIITEYRYIIVLILFGLQTFLNIWLISGWRRKRTVPIDGVFDTPQGTVSTNLNFGKLGIVCK